MLLCVCVFGLRTYLETFVCHSVSSCEFIVDPDNCVQPTWCSLGSVGSLSVVQLYLYFVLWSIVNFTFDRSSLLYLRAIIIWPSSNIHYSKYSSTSVTPYLRAEFHCNQILIRGQVPWQLSLCQLPKSTRSPWVYPYSRRTLVPSPHLHLR